MAIENSGFYPLKNCDFSIAMFQSFSPWPVTIYIEVRTSKKHHCCPSKSDSRFSQLKIGGERKPGGEHLSIQPRPLTTITAKPQCTGEMLQSFSPWPVDDLYRGAHFEKHHCCLQKVTADSANLNVLHPETHDVSWPR